MVLITVSIIFFKVSTPVIYKDFLDVKQWNEDKSSLGDTFPKDQ
jgi:hypothetical protein